MGFWSKIPEGEVARLKQRYVELGSLQALSDSEGIATSRLGRLLLAHDRRVAGADADYSGPERRSRAS